MSTATIVKWGNSQGIRLPKMLLDSVNMSENDTIEITAKDNSLILKKADNAHQKTIEELFEDFDGEYEPINIDWGDPVEDEVW
jgi:antitoxin MazE